MSIQNADVVDAIGLERSTQDVILTISDHLGWGSDIDNHLIELQEKINAYLAFLESGELLDAYPKAVGRDAVISIVFRESPPEQALSFLQSAATIIEDSGKSLRWEVLAR